MYIIITESKNKSNYLGNQVKPKQIRASGPECQYRLRAIITRSRILTINKDRIFWKNLLGNKEMVFQNGIKSIQAAAYNDARTVYKPVSWFIYERVSAVFTDFCSYFRDTYHIVAHYN